MHVSEIDALVAHDTPLPELNYGENLSDADMRIGKYIAEIIEDGATLQMGIGSIPDAVLRCLDDHKNLGVHTEMFSEGLIPLIESGVVNNKNKRKHPGKVVTLLRQPEPVGCTTSLMTIPCSPFWRQLT